MLSKTLETQLVAAGQRKFNSPLARQKCRIIATANGFTIQIPCQARFAIDAYNTAELFYDLDNNTLTVIAGDDECGTFLIEDFGEIRVPIGPAVYDPFNVEWIVNDFISVRMKSRTIGLF